MMFFPPGVDKKLLCSERFPLSSVDKDIDESSFSNLTITNDEVTPLLLLAPISRCFRKLRVRNLLLEMALHSAFRLFSRY